MNPGLVMFTYSSPRVQALGEYRRVPKRTVPRFFAARALDNIAGPMCIADQIGTLQ
jgi:hypothetical protein